MNVALLCNNEDLGLRVLHCIARTGAVVHVLGTAKPRFMRVSRWCHKYAPVQFPESPADFTEFADRLVAYATANAIDIFVPSDDVAASYLAEVQDRLGQFKCFPVTGRDQLVALTDKWKFGQFLAKNHIPAPKTKLISELAEIAPEHLAGIAFPVIVKPPALFASIGVVKIHDIDELGSYVRGDSPANDLPLIVQEFIPGHDVCLSVLAIEGELVAWTAQYSKVPLAILEFFENDEMLEIGRQIVRHSGFHGVAHFDMRRNSNDGSIVVLECNPRFWQTIRASMWHGVNFVKLGIEWALSGKVPMQPAYRLGWYFGTEAIPLKEFWARSTLRNFSKENLRAFVHEFSDPLPTWYDLISDWKKAAKRRLPGRTDRSGWADGWEHEP
jgi:predicted ATP-grasp superfamily ATP-dependent carboligase